MSTSHDALTKRITSNPDIGGGRPIVRGTRMRVQDILDLLANGASVAEVLQDYPYLEEADIRAALAYAANALDHPVIAAE